MIPSKRSISVTNLLVATTVSVTACSPATNPAEEQGAAERDDVAIVQDEMPGDDAKAKMLLAKEALFTALSGRLMESMSQRGPASAIAVCQKEATRIAETVGKENGLRIGRTGVRLRNPENVAPSWAASLVGERVDTPTFAVLDNGDSAALLPIKLQGQCLMCHGPGEQIAPAIRDQLAKLYPDDRAIGFREGELRGWFWIELPGG